MNRREVTFAAMPAYITKADTADAEALSALVNSAYRGDSSRAGWTTEADLLDGTRTDAAAIAEALCTPGVAMLKYTEDNVILGCVEIVNMGSALYLGMLTVNPLMQGRGIGKMLMLAAEEEALRQKCTAVTMTVISERDGLIAWYLRHGYRLTGECKPFAFNDVRFGIPKKPLEFVVLEKRL